MVKMCSRYVKKGVTLSRKSFLSYVNHKLLFDKGSIVLKMDILGKVMDV